MTRHLYDQEYLASGCTSGFDDIYTVDDTVGTYVTNFMILAVCLVAVIKLFCFPRRTEQGKPHSETSPYMLVFFECTGIAFGVAGVLHVIVKETSDPRGDILQQFLVAFSCIANACLALLVLTLRTENDVAWWILAGACAGISGYIVFVQPYVVAVFQLLVTVFAIIVYGLEAKKWHDVVEIKRPNLWKIVAMILFIMGTIVQPLLRGVCGDPAYEECFQDCPLPNPAVFNHNALFHVLHLLGVIVLAVAEDRLPSVPISQQESSGGDYEKLVTMTNLEG